MTAPKDCPLCDPDTTDDRFGRLRVWESEDWRASVLLRGAAVAGTVVLESVTHVPDIAYLNGPAAATLGGTLSLLSRSLRDAAEAEVVYVYSFGIGTRHLHFLL